MSHFEIPLYRPAGGRRSGAGVPESAVCRPARNNPEAGNGGKNALKGKYKIKDIKPKI
jgi:hypothetical protein